MDLLLGFFAALCISMVLVPVLIRFAPSLRLVDEPNEERRMHSSPVPRTGGIAIAAGSLFSVLFWLPLQEEYRALAVGVLIILMVGLADDFFQLSYRWKFSGQVLAAVVLVVGRNRLPSSAVHGIRDCTCLAFLAINYCLYRWCNQCGELVGRT